jgi:phosphatidylserine decarboxylase
MVGLGAEKDSKAGQARGGADRRARSVGEARPPLGVLGRLLFALVVLLPRNAVSRWAGRLASVRLPGLLQRAEIRLFVWLAGVDASEAAEPIEAYPSLNRFFTRALREGARPIASEPDALVSPCDGAWGAAGRIEGGTLLQVKGRSYRVEDLLGDEVMARAFEGGTFATLYLSPRDYHRFHTPAAGVIRRLDYWPGSLWPVNELGLLGVDALFARNERICAYLEMDVDYEGAGRGPYEPGGGAAVAGDTLALVAVGATMVGSVRLRFDDLRTNRRSAGPERRDLGEAAPRFERGEEWGHF